MDHGFLLTPVRVSSQMDDAIHTEENGWVHTECLFGPGMPRLFWEMLQQQGYMEPPVYVGRQYVDRGQRSCEMHVAVPAHPTDPWRPAWTVEVSGIELHDTWDVAALEATLCYTTKNPLYLMRTPYTFMPVRDSPMETRKLLREVTRLPNHPLYSPYMGALWDFSECMISMHRTREAELDTYVRAMRQQNDKVEEMKGSQLAQASQIQNLEAQLADEEQQSKDLDELVTDQGTQISQLEAQIADLGGQNAQLGQQVAGLNEQKAQLEGQVAGLSDRNAELEHQVGVMQANLEQAWQQNDEDHDEIEELQQDLAHIQADHPHQWGPDSPEELALAHDDLVGCE
jgi:hypothetical protein